MTVAIAMINITLFALGGALASFTLSLGVGFALFAVISIIRLRSDEAGWIEMAYLLVGLSTGLILGLPGYSLIAKSIYASVLVVAMWIIDGKRLFGRSTVRKFSVTLDGVTSTKSEEVKARVEALLGVTVDQVTIKSVQSMPAAMKVEVRYREQNQ